MLLGGVLGEDERELLVRVCLETIATRATYPSLVKLAAEAQERAESAASLLARLEGSPPWEQSGADRVALAKAAAELARASEELRAACEAKKDDE